MINPEGKTTGAKFDAANAAIAKADVSGATAATSDFWKNLVDRKISIKLGNYAFFDCVVITKVQQTYSSLLDSQGKPTHVVVELSFKPMFITTQDDLNNIFLGKF